MKIYCLILLPIFFICCKKNIYLHKQKNSPEITMRINDVEKYDVIYKIDYSINNTSKGKHYFPLIDSFSQKIRDKKDLYSSNFYVLLFDKNDAFIPSNIYTLPYNGDLIPRNVERIENKIKLKQLDSLTYHKSIKPFKFKKSGILDYARYYFIKKDDVVLDKNNIHKSAAFFNPKRCYLNFLLSGDLYEYDMKDSKIKYIQLLFKSDSNKVKQYLLPKDIDSLRKNKIKIFHGILYSNKFAIKEIKESSLK